MKIGIICEGEYTDKPVLEEILQHKFPNHDFKIIARDKKAIFLPCFQDINHLIQEGISRIAIVWDLLPVGKRMAISSQWSEKPNRREQRQMLLQKLVGSDELHDHARTCFNNLCIRYGFIDGTNSYSPLDIRLICICYTMDGWLLSDDRVLKKLGSTNAHPVNNLEPSPTLPDRNQNPVRELTAIFKRCPNKRFKHYNKHQHNGVIVRAYIEEGRIDRMRVSGSYARLIDTIQEWVAP